MDLGAGRIGHHHELMVDLIKQLKLEGSMYDITNTENYIEYDPTTKTSINKSSLKQLSRLLSKLFHSLKISSVSKTLLEKLYLNELLKISLKSIQTLKNFEYNKLYHLIVMMLLTILNMIIHHNQFFIMTNGMSSIIYKMLAIISQNKNYKFYKNHNVDNISYNIDNNNYIIKSTNTISHNNFQVQAKHIVCALPRCNN